jgi:hypothetical protein
VSARQVLVPLDMTKLEIRNFVFHLLAAAPGSPVEGIPFWNTATHTLEIWNGSAWDIFGTLDQISAPAADVAMATHKLTGVGDPTNPQDAATRAWTLALKVSDLTALAADWSVNSHKITSVSNGTSTGDAVNKGQLDAATLGLSWKAPVRCIATTDATLATAYAAGQVVDGVTLVLGDRIALAGQTAGETNGIRIVTAGTPTRSTDADSAAEVLQMAFAVEEGTASHDTIWQCTTNAPITLDTTPLVISALPGVMVAGAGLTSTGATMNVVAGATPGSGGPGGGLVADADDIVIDTAVVARKFSVDVGDNASTSIVLTHNLGTLDVLVQVYVKGTGGALVDCDVQHTTTNTVTLVFAVAPTAAQYRATVLG